MCTTIYCSVLWYTRVSVIYCDSLPVKERFESRDKDVSVKMKERVKLGYGFDVSHSY